MAATQTTSKRILRRSMATPRDAGARVYTTVIKRAETNTSQQVSYEDAFSALSGGAAGLIPLPTPFPVGYLFDVISISSSLGQAIQAFLDNTVGTGWEAGAVIRGRTPRPTEKGLLESFVSDANATQSLDSVMDAVIRDRESAGFGFMEIIRDSAGNTALAKHAPALFTRLCPIHPDEVEVTYDVPRGERMMPVKEFRKFRRFVQQVGARFVYFKEFGDPRKMDRQTGLFSYEPGYVAGREATEIWHWKLPSNEPYGKPRWINQLPNILGVRESEEGNWRYFEDNTVPPALLTVSGGRLTADSAAAVQRMLQSHGADKQNRMVLVEAVGEGADVGESGTGSIQIKVEKLTDARQSDSLFDKYDEGTMRKVLSSWRMTPAAIGRSSSAKDLPAELQVMETTVFAPERAKIDEQLNKGLTNSRAGLGLVSVKLVSRTPAISSPDQFIKSLTALNVMGAVTPRRAQQVANKMLQIEIEEYPQPGEDGYEDWMDQPIIMVRSKTQGTPNDAAGSDPGGDALANGKSSAMPGKKHTEQQQKTPEIKAIENNGETA